MNTSLTWVAMGAAAVITQILGCCRRGSDAGQGRAGSPAWAEGWSADERGELLRLVRAKLGEDLRGLDEVAGTGVLAGVQGQGGQISLHNLARLCRQAARSEWARLVGEHCDSLLGIAQEEARWLANPGDYEAVADLLAVRLYGSDLGVSREDTVSREDLPGTRTMLLFNLPRTVRFVRKEEAAAWGRPLEEVFERAMANVRRDCLVRTERIALGDGVAITVVAGKFFASAYALWLGEVPGCVGKQGALLAVPARDAVLAMPVEKIEVAKYLPNLIKLADEVCRKGPEAIVPKVYWFRGGMYVEIPYKIEKRGLEVRPPEEFVEMLNSWAAS